MLFRNFLNSPQEKFPLIALLFPRIYAILMGKSSFSSTGSASLNPSPTIMKNLEEWEIVRDKAGRLVKIIVHRDVKQG